MSRNEDFLHELTTLMSAPYAYIHIVTHDEARAVALVSQIATDSGRPLREWSVTRGLSGGEAGASGPGEINGLLDAIESDSEATVYLLKDAGPHLDDLSIRRRFRDMEPVVAAFGKTLVMVSTVPFGWEDLSADVTEVTLPMPDRAELSAVARIVFPMENWGELDREGLVNAALGLTSRQALRAFHRARLEAASDVAMHRVVHQEKRRVVSRTDVVEFVENDRGLADLGGLAALKDWLVARRDAFGGRARAFGLPAPRGLLLLGVQGCGKSLTARVVASHWGLPLLRMDIGSLFGGRQSPDRALRRALEIAEAVSPTVLWVDEIDKAFERGGDGSQTRLLGGLLTWLQEKEAPVFFVATANRVDGLPPELLRKGRFDEIFFVDLPDRSSREEILRIHLSRRGRDPDDYDIVDVSEAAHNFSGAELEQVVVPGLYEAFGRDGELTSADLLLAIRQTVPLSKTCEEEIKDLRIWARDRARFATRDATEVEYFGGALKETR
jgi:ATP-dependent 26S proteasome regulatory subunit